MGFVQVCPENEQAAWCGELLPGSPSAPMSLPEGFPPVAKSKVPLPGYQRGAGGENSGLCTGPPVLGREVQPTYPRPTMPFGGEHPRVEGSDGALCLLPWWHHLRWCSPTGRILEGPAWGNHSWECSPSLPNFPIEGPTAEETAPVGGSLEEPSTPQTLFEEQTTRVEASPIWFPGWRKVLHPSRLITTTGQAPPVSHESRWRPHNQSSGRKKAQCWRVEDCQQAEKTRKESALSPEPMEAIQKVALPPQVPKKWLLA